MNVKNKISSTNCSRKLTVKERHLADYIGVGVENARTLNEMIVCSGESDRTTRFMIEGLRRAGIIICSDENGYFKPANIDELRRYVRKEHARARSIFMTTKPASDLLKKIEKENNGNG